MRITIVLGPFLPVPAVLGGAVEKVHLLLAQVYRDAGHDVTIISRQYKNFPREETIEGIKHIRIASSDRSSSLAVNLALDLLYAVRVARNLPASDVTVTNSFSLPLVLPRRGAGKIYVHVARFPKHQMRLYFRADRLQAISQAVADVIVEQAPGLANRVATIGYPVPDAYFCSKVALRGKTVLYVGRIAREKGVHLLVTAFARIAMDTSRAGADDWKLRIVGPHEVAHGGDGAEYLDELNVLAQPLGSRCEFVGPIFDEGKLIAEYQAASVFVYPSLAEKGEALGLAPLEAMAAGCATIVSGLRCFDDFVENGVSGLKFDHRSRGAEAGLASQIGRLVAEPGLLNQIATGGHRVACRFKTHVIAAQMLEDFELVVSGGAH